MASTSNMHVQPRPATCQTVSELSRSTHDSRCRVPAHAGRLRGNGLASPLAAVPRAAPTRPSIGRAVARVAVRLHARARHDARVRSARSGCLASRDRRTGVARLRRRRGVGAGRGRERRVADDARYRARAAHACPRDDAVRAAARACRAHVHRRRRFALHDDERLVAFLLPLGLTRRIARDVGRVRIARDAALARRHDRAQPAHRVSARLELRRYTRHAPQRTADRDRVRGEVRRA